MAGPERRFIDKIHRRLDPTIWKQSTTGIAGSNGIPDYYYEGPTGGLWIEYKAVAGNFPQIINIIDKRPKLTPLQRQWVDRAFNNTVEVAVILGGDQGGIIFTQGTWANNYALSVLKIWGFDDCARAIHEVVVESGAIDNWQS